MKFWVQDVLCTLNLYNHVIWKLQDLLFRYDYGSFFPFFFCRNQPFNVSTNEFVESSRGIDLASPRQTFFVGKSINYQSKREVLPAQQRPWKLKSDKGSVWTHGRRKHGHTHNTVEFKGKRKRLALCHHIKTTTHKNSNSEIHDIHSGSLNLKKITFLSGLWFPNFIHFSFLIHCNRGSSGIN